MKANKTKGKRAAKAKHKTFGYDAKQAFVMGYTWASEHYKDWEDCNSIATNTGFIAATILQEYINSKPKF